MKTILLLFCLTTIISKDATFFTPPFSCPFRKGVYIKKGDDLKMDRAYTIPRGSLEIIGTDNKVFSASKGSAESIVTYENKSAISIESGNYTIIYEDLNSVLISKGSKVDTNTIIGFVNEKRIELTILNKRRQVLSPDKMLIVHVRANCN